MASNHNIFSINSNKVRIIASIKVAFLVDSAFIISNNSKFSLIDFFISFSMVSLKLPSSLCLLKHFCEAK